jgi:hypothetical protein
MAVRRNRINNWTINLLLAFSPAFFAFVPLELTVQAFVDDKYVDPSPGRLAFAFALAAFFALIALRALRRGVTVSEAGCTARRVLSTRRTPWRDVERFVTGEDDRGEDSDFARYKVFLKLFDGRQRKLPLDSLTPKTVETAAKWLNEQRRVLDRSKA